MYATKITKTDDPAILSVQKKNFESVFQHSSFIFVYMQITDVTNNLTIF